jgi:hypothetical protein
MNYIVWVHIDNLTQIRTMSFPNDYVRPMAFT